MEKSFREIVAKSQELARAYGAHDPKPWTAATKVLDLVKWAGTLAEEVLAYEGYKKEQFNRDAVVEGLNSILFILSDLSQDLAVPFAENYIAYLNKVIAHLNNELKGRRRGGGDMEPLEHVLSRNERVSSLRIELQRLYGSDLVFPGTYHGSAHRPYVIGNFVTGIDGVASYADVPGRIGGGDVSGFNAQDKFVMGLLRALADGVIVGANTLRSEPEHLWTPAFISPEHEALFCSQREQMEKGYSNPYNIFVTGRGNINFEAAVFKQSDIRVIIVTTEQGNKRIRDSVPEGVSYGIVIANSAGGSDTEIDINDMLRKLKHEWGICYLLCEGGPGFYNSLERAGCVDELFQTIAPKVVGNSKTVPRPTMSVSAGPAYRPEESPQMELISVKQKQSYLYLRWKYLR